MTNNVLARRRAFAYVAAAFATYATAPAARAQTSTIDGLAEHALAVNSTVRAAEARVAAARQRIAPAGSWPEPMLMAGVVNVPLGDMPVGHGAPARPDPMTMKMIGIEQTIPWPGKLSLAGAAARAELAEAEAELARVQLHLASRVRAEYFDLAFYDRAVDVVERNQRVLTALIEASEARYAAGTGAQVEVLNARVDASRLAEQASELVESRRGALARLNALLERPSDANVHADFPRAVIAAAAPQDATRVRFVSAALGARAADSPLRPLDELQQQALTSSPVLHAQRARIEAARARSLLARRELLPDINVSLQYGQRTDLPDMVSAIVSVPLPIHSRRKQRPLAAAASAEVTAAEADARAAEQELMGRIAELHANLERQRTRLALYTGAVIPQAQAAVNAATATFQSGRTSLFELLGHQATLFAYETEYLRALADFGRQLAELEAVVGAEVLR